MADLDQDRIFVRRVQRFALICFLNFAAFMAGAFCLGGEAVNGRVENGRYLIATTFSLSFPMNQFATPRSQWPPNRPGYREVSAATFYYSKWHGLSVLISWPPMMFASFFANLRRKRRAYWLD
jgi:hypothetical protein